LHGLSRQFISYYYNSTNSLPLDSATPSELLSFCKNPKWLNFYSRKNHVSSETLACQLVVTCIKYFIFQRPRYRPRSRSPSLWHITVRLTANNDTCACYWSLECGINQQLLCSINGLLSHRIKFICS